MFDPINRFREKLRAGQTCFGVSVTLGDPLITEALADSVDFIWIDTEHTAIGIEALGGHLLAARGKAVPALVRVAGSATAIIKPVLDIGAAGVIVPQVRSTEEVRRVIEDCRYPPTGRRGYGPRIPSNYGRAAGDGYIQRADQGVFVVAQIENTEALAAIDEIVALPGLDSVVLGPWDLAHSMGLNGDVEHPRVRAAIDKIVAKAKAHGVFVGSGMGASAEFAKAMAARGIQWLQVGCDFDLMIQSADRLRNEIQGVAAPKHARKVHV